jgi:predicted membrane-bound spermidine synthase
VLPLIVFFLSGFAALLYQVIWQRLLVIFSGADVYSVTVIVAAFMAGLGTGSLGGGHLADRLGPRGNLLAFAGAELVVGVFGFFSKWLFYDTLYARFGTLAASPTLAAIVLFATLLLPTFLMGASLPLLARALAGSLHTTPRVIGLLYGSNTLGAAAGAFTATWVLVPRLGLDRALWIAAGVNILCAMLGARIASQLDVSPSRDGGLSPDLSAEPIEHVATSPTVWPFRVWVVLYAFTGFTALALEMAWFRLLGVLLKSTSFTFGTLLAVYLAGLGAGAAVGAHKIGRSRHPGATFLALQYGLAIYVAVSVTLLVATIAAGHPIALARFLGSYEPINVYETFVRIANLGWFHPQALESLTGLSALYLVVPLMLIGPPTFLMGMSFPYLQKASHADVHRIGRRLGMLLAANITGGVLGTVATGWVLLTAAGTAGTLKIVVAASVALAWLLVTLAANTPRQLAYGALGATALTILAVSMMPASVDLWARLHGTTRGHVLFDEDSAGLSLLKFDRAGAGGAVEVYVSGLGQSWLPYGNIHTALGALPAFMHPAPKDVAIIGLGSGDTAFAAAGRAEIERLTSIEILGAQRRTLERFLQFHRYPGLLALLSDPRVEHRVGDGRAYISQSGRIFDIIEADALRPSSAYSGNLYSREYFALIASRLKPGGFGVTWAPTARIRDTFISVFPYVLAFAGDVYIGSNSPIDFNAVSIAKRVEAARFYYEPAGVDIVALMRQHLDSPPRRFSPAHDRRSRELNTDMFPRDEFALPF